MSDQHVEDEGEDRVARMIRPHAGGWDGEGPDHFTELERRLIINLRTCQQWCIRTEDKLSRLMYALGEVIAVLEEIRQEETLGSE